MLKGNFRCILWIALVILVLVVILAASASFVVLAGEWRPQPEHWLTIRPSVPPMSGGAATAAQPDLPITS